MYVPFSEYLSGSSFAPNALLRASEYSETRAKLQEKDWGHWKCVYNMPQRVQDVVHATLRKASSDGVTISKDGLLSFLQLTNPHLNRGELLRLYTKRFRRLTKPFKLQEIVLVNFREWQKNRKRVIKEVESLGFFWLSVKDYPIDHIYEEEFQLLQFDIQILSRFNNSAFCKLFAEYDFPEKIDRHVQEDLIYLLETIRQDRSVFNELLRYATTSWHFYAISKFVHFAHSQQSGYESFRHFVRDEILQDTLAQALRRKVNNCMDIIGIFYYIVRTKQLVMPADHLLMALNFDDPDPRSVRELIEQKSSNLGKVHISMWSPIESIFIRHIMGKLKLERISAKFDYNDEVLEREEMKLKKYHQNSCLNPACDRIHVKMKRCTRCDAAVYCSAECQRDDYAKHKKFCKKLSKLHATKIR